MEPDPPRGRARHVLWLGRAGLVELDAARAALAGVPGCVVTLREALDRGPPLPAPPDCIVLADDRAGEWTTERVLGVTRRLPLVPVVAVSGSLADGRRRSGPTLPGVEEIPWHDLAGRLAAWFADLDRGTAGSIGLPPTSRREDRILAGHAALAPSAAPPHGAVAVVAGDRQDLEGLVDLVRVCGHRTGATRVGRPSIDTLEPILVWDVRGLSPEDLEWLRLLSANRPGLATVLLDSFPRGDSSADALAAGAAAVLGRPTSREVLAGTLASLASRGRGGGAAGREG